jgi:hypothetical protein
LRDAVWRKAHPPFVPGPRILGVQAPGKVGSTRQERSSWVAVWRKPRPAFVSPGNKRKTISNEVVFLCFMQVIVRNESWGSTIHTAGECISGRSVAKSSSAFRHVAGACVWGRNVAKSPLFVSRIAR